MNKEGKERDPLVEQLRASMAALNLSPEEASGFLGVSFRTIYRWLDYEFKPSPLSRKAIRNGIRRMDKVKRGRGEASHVNPHSDFIPGRQK